MIASWAFSLSISLMIVGVVGLVISRMMNPVCAMAATACVSDASTLTARSSVGILAITRGLPFVSSDRINTPLN